MEENKELETTTEEQASVTPAANNGEKKGLFLSGLIVGFAATLLIVGGIFIAFQIHNIMTMKDDVAAQVSYGEDSAVNAQTIKKLQLLEDTVKENFYLSEVTNEQLEDGMFRGLMDSLDDPYSEYYTAEELKKAVCEDGFAESAFVESVTGVGNICERSALLAAGVQKLLIPKTARNGVTVAAAVMDLTICMED